MRADLTPYTKAWAGKPPTARQAQALTFIAAYTAEHGYPPTVREISDSMGIASNNGASEHVDRLERKGLVTRARLVARGLVLTASGKAFLESTRPGPAPAGAEGGS